MIIKRFLLLLLLYFSLSYSVFPQELHEDKQLSFLEALRTRNHQVKIKKRNTMYVNYIVFSHFQNNVFSIPITYAYSFKKASEVIKDFFSQPMSHRLSKKQALCLQQFQHFCQKEDLKNLNEIIKSKNHCEWLHCREIEGEDFTQAKEIFNIINLIHERLQASSTMQNDNEEPKYYKKCVKDAWKNVLEYHIKKISRRRTFLLNAFKFSRYDRIKNALKLPMQLIQNISEQ